MNGQAMRHRRLLSGVRRTGLQVDPQVANGRTQRGAQGWKDQQYDDIEGDGLRMLRHAIFVGIAAWMAVGLVFWFVVELAR